MKEIITMNSADPRWNVWLEPSSLVHVNSLSNPDPLSFIESIRMFVINYYIVYPLTFLMTTPIPSVPPVVIVPVWIIILEIERVWKIVVIWVIVVVWIGIVIWIIIIIRIPGVTRVDHTTGASDQDAH